MWLWFVITGIIVVLLVGHAIYWEDGLGDIILSLIGGAFIGGLACAILAFFIGGIMSANPNIMMDNIESNNEIIALTDNTQASYLYRSVDRNNNIKYNYMIETDRGYLTQSIMANRAYIIETDDKTPSVETHRVIYKSEFLREHFFNDNTRYYYIYVPEGTIVGGFNIDLQ